MSKEDRPDGYPDTPTLDAIADLGRDRERVGEFLEWLFFESDYTLAEWPSNGGGYSRGSMVPVGMSIEEVLAEYYEIDLDAMREEKEAVYQWLQEQRGLEKDEVELVTHHGGGA